VSTFTAPERRELGERAAHGGAATPGLTQAGAAVDAARARRVLPILQSLLAVRPSVETVHDE
jgi:hypothetical protein